MKVLKIEVYSRTIWDKSKLMQPPSHAPGKLIQAPSYAPGMSTRGETSRTKSEI